MYNLMKIMWPIIFSVRYALETKYMTFVTGNSEVIWE